VNLSQVRMSWSSDVVSTESDVVCCKQYPVQTVTEIYNKNTVAYNFVSKLENFSWNVLCLLLSEVAYFGTGHSLRSYVFVTIGDWRA
jgi:hypothetical protein